VHRLRPWMASIPSTRQACLSGENGLRADSEPGRLGEVETEDIDRARAVEKAKARGGQKATD